MVKVDNVTIAIIAGVVILAGLAFYVLFWSKPSSDAVAQAQAQAAQAQAAQAQAQAQAAQAQAQAQAARAQANQQASQNAAGRPVLILFYGERCPHCHSMMPAWKEMKKTIAGRMDVREIEGKNPSMSQYTPMKGVPTVRLYPNGVEDRDNFIEYKGDRSTESLLNFAATGK